MEELKIPEQKKQNFSQRVLGTVSRIGTLNIVLLCVFGYMIYLNWKMIQVFLMCGTAPETAWCALIAALLGECGICGWIKTSKEKRKYRDDLEDKKL